MKITIRNLQKKIPINQKKAKTAILKLLSCRRKNKAGQITICLVNDKKIQELNHRFLRKNEPTDVLSFDMSEKKAHRHRLIADIVVSVETALKNSRVFHTTPRYELNLYIVHGLLHLLGYDDRSSQDRKLMQKEADCILNKFPII